VPDATFRLDANAGFTAQEALAVARATERLGLTVECFEQPCGKHALDEMAKVAAELAVPVIADESFQRLGDLAVLSKEKAADGVNLKLAKLGSPEAAVTCGRIARRKYGLTLMVGAMVETRLGIAAAASVAAALGGVEFPDLDTAFLLAGDPFHGGFQADGPALSLSQEPGLGVRVRDP
jgi:L-alanine-DL-glutamate epimerase-like enolase superfamily enzyme